MLFKVIKLVLADTPTAVAVHIGASDSVWPADIMMRTIAESVQDIPIAFSVAIKMARDLNSGYISAISKGMYTFGLSELEVLEFSGSLQYLTNSMLGIAGYMVATKTVVKDGDTIDSSGGERLLIKYESSHFSPGERVMRIYFPQAESV